MELTVDQVALIGIIASVLSQAIKLISAKFQKDIGEKVTMVTVFIVSLVLAFIWLNPLIPTMDWSVEGIVMFLIEQIGSVLGFSVVIYTLLLKKLYEKLDLVKARFIGKG